MDRKKESEMFNQMADYYDRYRPDYPGETIRQVLDTATLQPGAKLLEIGAGSGKATAQFADFGFEIVCIEPGADLAKKGMNTFRAQDISFVNTRFEDYDAPMQYFDAIISAQAFHWLPKPDAYVKCAKTLKDGAHLAVFWNIELIDDTPLDRELHEIMLAYNAFTASMPRKNYAKRTESIASEIAESGYFEKPHVFHTHWEQMYSVESYFGYLSTGNVFVQNSNETKKACCEALERLSEKYGGIKRRFICELYMAQKK